MSDFHRLDASRGDVLPLLALQGRVVRWPDVLLAPQCLELGGEVRKGRAILQGGDFFAAEVERALGGTPDQALQERQRELVGFRKSAVRQEIGPEGIESGVDLGVTGVGAVRGVDRAVRHRSWQEAQAGSGRPWPRETLRSRLGLAARSGAPTRPGYEVIRPVVLR